MIKPRLIPLEIHVDNRGHLVQILGNYSFPMVKRIYIVSNWVRNIVRAFHYHNFEWKAYYITYGVAKFVTIYKDKTDKKEFILTHLKPQVLVIPSKYFQGWQNLTPTAILIGLSNFSLEESKNDDIRVPYDFFGKDLWGRVKYK